MRREALRKRGLVAGGARRRALGTGALEAADEQAHIQQGLVHTHRLDRVARGEQQCVELQRDAVVRVKCVGDRLHLCAVLACLPEAHPVPDAKRPGRVVARGHLGGAGHGAAGALLGVAHDHGLVAQLGVLPQADRDKEAVKVEVQQDAL